MLLTPTRTEERLWELLRQSGPLRGSAAEIARLVGGDRDDVRHALDELVSRNLLRRHDVPGGEPVYWS